MKKYLLFSLLVLCTTIVSAQTKTVTYYPQGMVTSNGIAMPATGGTPTKITFENGVAKYYQSYYAGGKRFILEYESSEESGDMYRVSSGLRVLISNDKSNIVEENSGGGSPIYTYLTLNPGSSNGSGYSGGGSYGGSSSGGSSLYKT